MAPLGDELVTAHHKSWGLRAVVLTTTSLSRHARDLHQAEAASASLLAQGLTGALMLAALQKEKTRVSLQVECDGPLRGFFADADTDGNVRGYVKNRAVEFLGEEGTFQFRPALGNKGYLSVLRDLGKGEFYRSSVELEAFDLSLDLERYFQTSDQVESRVELGVSAAASEPLGPVHGVLLQALPGGEAQRLTALGEAVRQRAATLGQEPQRSAPALLGARLDPLPDGNGVEITSRVPLSYQCTCSLERVERALTSMGAAALREVIEEDKKAELTCEFCARHYLLEEAALRSLLERVESGG
jgi:molecular chaperone Hsp33